MKNVKAVIQRLEKLTKPGNLMELCPDIMQPIRVSAVLNGVVEALKKAVDEDEYEQAHKRH